MRFLATLCLMLAIAIATVIVYAPVTDGALLNYDDSGNLVLNPYFHPLSVRNVAQLWRVPFFGTYSPLTYTLFAVECCFAQRSNPETALQALDPRVFHTCSIALHVIGSLLVFALLSQLTGNQLASTFGALAFGLHPCQVESVAWITETKTLLAGVFAVAALWQYVLFVKSQVCPPPRVGGRVPTLGRDYSLCDRRALLRSGAFVEIVNGRGPINGTCD